MKSSISAIILCGGMGKRFGSNKTLCYFGIKTSLEYCLDAFEDIADEIAVVASKKDFSRTQEIAALHNAKVVPGGNTRTESVKNGLNALSGDGIVLIHDGARPFVSQQVILACIESATKFGSGIAATKMRDTVKRVDGGFITQEIPRDDLYCMQTPQAFKLSEIKRAYNEIRDSYNDDSAVYSACGYSPHIVESPASNKKITYPEDMISTPPCQRIGTGVDFHRFAKGRKLILGGVEIPFDFGLIGNSDADALVHAIMDALLSAIDEPDIGVLFPCTEKFKDANSLLLLQNVRDRVYKKGYFIVNISATIMALAPKMRPYINMMSQTIADNLGIKKEAVGVSATTTEGLGIIGEGKGIACSAVCLLQQLPSALKN